MNTPNENLKSNRTPGELKRDRQLYAALLTLEAVPCEPFRTTRIAMAVESRLTPMTTGCSLYRLERDGIIRVDARRGTGTMVTILGRAPEA